MLKNILRAFTHRAEDRILSGKMAGIGVAMENKFLGVMFDKPLLALREALVSRGVEVVDISNLQAKWLRLPEEGRGSYATLSEEKFPDAQFYIVLFQEDEEPFELGFEIYGAAFATVLKARCKTPIDHLTGVLDRYFKDNICPYMTLTICKYPEAFTGALWYQPLAARGEIKKIFTLPPGFY